VGMETELKFALSPQRQRKVEKLVGKLSRLASEPVRRHEITRYYDFADLALFKAGFSLRVRQSDGAYVQTLKSLSAADGAMPVRFEREWALARDRLDVTRLAGTPVSRLMAARREAPIREVFATDIARVTYSLALDGDAVVELAVDNGHVRSGESAQPNSRPVRSRRSIASPRRFTNPVPFRSARTARPRGAIAWRSGTDPKR